MMFNLIGPFIVNAPFGTEIAFAKGLRRIGHEVNEVDPNVDQEMRGLRNDADATVVFKSCVGAERFLKSLKHPIVVYQPDDARFPHIKKMMLDMRQYADLLLSFDGYGAGVALTMGYRAAETLLLTADDELYCPSSDPNLERDIDVSFIGSLSDPVAHASRQKMCRIVQAEADRRGWKFVFGTTQDIPTILDVYRRSKVVLNHATDVGQGFGQGHGLQCRHFEVGMTKTCLISNGRPLALNDSLVGPFDFWNESELVENIHKVLSGRLNGRSLYEGLASIRYDEILKNHMPQHRATQLIDFIKRNS